MITSSKKRASFTELCAAFGVRKLTVRLCGHGEFFRAAAISIFIVDFPPGL